MPEFREEKDSLGVVKVPASFPFHEPREIFLFGPAAERHERRLRVGGENVVAGGDVERHERAGNFAAVDLNHQGLELMTQIAHGADARHAGAALERMQLAL